MKKLRQMAIVLLTGSALLLVASPSYSWDFFSLFRIYTTGTVDDGPYCEKDEPGTPVPEPTAALLFGAGLVVAGAASRRRARR